MDKFIIKINNSSWVDWSLNNIEVDFDQIVIYLSEELEGSVKFVCKDYMGISIIGHWDENIIESIKIENGGLFVQECLEKVKNLNERPVQGVVGIKDIDNDWYQMNIKLIDGNIYEFIFREIEVEVLD